MSKIRIESDGTPQGTKVFLPDGTEIAEFAEGVEIVMAQGEPMRVMLAYSVGSLEAAALELEPKHRPIAASRNSAPGAI